MYEISVMYMCVIDLMFSRCRNTDLNRKLVMLISVILLQSCGLTH